MDVMIEAAPAVAEATLGSVFVAISGFLALREVALPQKGVASVSRLLNTIIARGPNYILRKELALAAA